MARTLHVRLFRLRLSLPDLQEYLSSMDRKMDDFFSMGIGAIAISSDSQ